MSDAAPKIVNSVGFRCLIALLCGLTCVTLGLAANSFQQVQSIEIVKIPLSEAEFSIQGDSVCGQFKSGLPRYELRWDGEPPRAWLANKQTGEALSAPLLMDASLSLNGRGVLWKGKEGCRFVVDLPTYEALGSNLVLEVEQIRSRRTFYVWLCSSLALGVIAFACWQQVRIYSTKLERRVLVRWDEARKMSFVLLSLASVIVFYPGHPVANMSGDPANIHSFAAALNSPEDFLRDSVLSDDRNYQWYTPLYVKLVQMFGWAGMHYATSRAFLVFVSSLVGLFGYYSLFRLVSRSAVYAFAATLGLWFLKAHYPPNENWGPMLVLPRTVYGAFLPWVAVFALKCLRRSSLWIFPAALSGALFYIHPVSSPALSGALLMGFVWGGRGAISKRILWGVLAAIGTLAVMFPYVVVYSNKYAGTVVKDAELTSQAFEAARERFAPGYLEPLVFQRDCLIFLATTPRYWLGIVALGWLLKVRSKTLATRVSVGVTLGFVIVTFVIPTLDVLISSRLGRLPFQIDLIRNLRYLDVLLLAIVGAALREINRPQTGRRWSLDLQMAASQFLAVRRFSCKLAPAIAVSWVAIFFVPSLFCSIFRMGEAGFDNITILIGRPRGQIALDMESFRAVKTLRRKEERVGGTFHLRQIHVPVAFNNKDLGVLAYSSPASLVNAKNVLQQSEGRMNWPLDNVASLDQASILEAEMLLLPREQVAPSLTRSDAVLFQNAGFLLVRPKPEDIAAHRKALALTSITKTPPSADRR